jgi:uncharacterized membrane protein YciS (DUF1049 family)
MEQTAWLSAARPLVLLHAALSIVLVGAASHHAVATYGYVTGRQTARLSRIHAAIVGVAYPLTMVVGALAYPTYRYYVRALFLDRYEPWASNLFDIKENLATVGLPLALATWWLSRYLGTDEDRPVRFGYVTMVGLVTAIVWMNVGAGLLVTMIRGVP